MKHSLFSFVALVALWTAACSSGGSTISPPPPAGKFTLASLSGTYAFTTSGEVCAGCSVAATPMARVGSFIADSKGNITGGVYDVVTEGGGSSTVPINSGSSYTVTAEGRGTLKFKVTSSGAPAEVDFGFVFTSGSSGASPASDGLMIDETSNGTQASTGSGNFVLQTPGAFAVSNISGSYVFDFSGFDGNITSGPFPESLVGQFVAASGTINSGFEDSNDGGGLGSGSITTPVTMTADPVNMASSGRGTVLLENQSYAFYIVDVNRVRFISTNAVNGPMLSGDAVFQNNNIPAPVSSNLVFLVGGTDSAGNGLTRVGRFTATSPFTKMLMDVNDASQEFQFNNLSGGSISSYDATTGRGQFSFQDSTGQTYAFVFYLSSPNSGVLQDVSPSGTAGIARVVADGSIEAQSGAPFSSSNITGTYGLNWSGLVTAGGNFANTDEEDLVSQVKVSNLAFSGTSDIFQFTSSTLMPKLDIGTSGQINVNGDGTNGDGNRVTMSVSLSNQAAINMVVYVADPQLAFFINTNQSGAPRNIAGILKAQQ